MTKALNYPDSFELSRPLLSYSGCFELSRSFLKYQNALSFRCTHAKMDIILLSNIQFAVRGVKKASRVFLRSLVEH